MKLEALSFCMTSVRESVVKMLKKDEVTVRIELKRRDKLDLVEYSHLPLQVAVHSGIVLNMKFEASTCHVLLLIYPTKHSRI